MDYLEKLIRGIEYMETNLEDECSLQQISSAACISRFHFHRIFTALTGETPGDYIRSRRLSKASLMLVESNRGVLEIALDAGYESQEAFTRAFKRQFRETPSRFRKKGYTSHFLRREALTAFTVKHLIEGVSMKPEIITKESFTLMGVEGKTSKNNVRVAGIWQQLFALVPSIPGQKHRGVMYGVGEYMDPAEFTDNTDFTYFAGVEVEPGTELSDGFSLKVFPERQWAVFTHKGGVDTLMETFNYIYGPWALKTKEKILEADDMEYYDSRFNPADPEKSEIDIYIPIEKNLF